MHSKTLLARTGCAVTAALSLCLALGQPVTAHAASSTVDDGVYVLRSAASNKTVAVESGHKASGGNVFQWSDNSRVGERWQLQRSGGHYVVRSIQTNLVLDVYGAGKANGANVQLWKANGSAAQQWDLVDNGDGSYSLRSVCNGLVLDVSGGSRSNGANIQVWQGNGTNAQKFSLESTKPIPEGTYAIRSAAGTSKVLDVPSASSSNGARIQLWEKNGSSAQKWALTYDANTGYYRLSAACSGKVLDVPAANGSNGTRLQQYQSNGSAAQTWDIRKASGNACSIKTPLTSRALDVPAGNASNGAQVQLWDSNGTKAQQWAFEEDVPTIEDGLYTIASSLDSSKVLDVASASMSPDARMQVYSANGTLAQKWSVSLDEATKTYTIKSANSGLYLSDANGTLKGADSISDASRWTPKSGSNGGVTFVNASTKRALDLSCGSTSNGNSVGTYASNGTGAQSWKLSRVSAIGDGTYVLSTYTDLGKALDVSGGSKSDGAAVQVYQKNGTAAQAWTVKSAGNGYVSIANAGSAMAVSARLSSSTHPMAQRHSSGSR